MRTAAGLGLAFAIAASLTLVVALGGEPAWEAEAIRSVQSLPLGGAQPSKAVQEITRTEVVLAIGAALAFALWLGGSRREAAALAVALVVLPLAQSGLKELLDRPRPPPELLHPGASHSSPSFPSGHVMGSTFVFGWLVYEGLRRDWRPVFRTVIASASLALVLLAGLTSLYLGVHWPTDVLGGYAWGLALLLASLGVASGLTRWRGADRG
jgi:undecaprenyl-diphosphatase